MKKRERNSFLTPLVVEVMPSGKTFKVAREFTYVWRRAFPIHVKVGFVTDFASIPRFARIIIPKLGKYTKASVIHDFLYQRGSIPDSPKDSNPRKTADVIFRDGMRDLGVVKWKRWVMWAAVRVGGHFAWKKRPAGQVIPWNRNKDIPR